MKKQSIPITTFLILALITVSFACGPWLPSNYLGHGNETRTLFIPNTVFIFELRQILVEEGIVTEPVEGYIPGTGYIDHPDYYENTVKQDIKDLEQALDDNGVTRAEKEKALEQYVKFRNGLQRPKEKVDYDSWNRIKHKTTPRKLPDLGDLSYLPEEFSEYIRGASAYWHDDGEQAISHWQNVLRLSTGQRKYRTVWASFMTGKAYLKELGQPEEAIKQFNETLELIDAGFADTLNLADEIPGLIARCYFEMGDDVRALHLYLEQCRDIEKPESAAAFRSVRYICRKAFKEDHPVPFSERVQDNLYCRVIATWCISNYGTTQGLSEEFLEALENSGRTKGFNGSEIIARVLYESGKFDDAEKMLKYCSEDNFMTHWVRSKLLLRDGKMKESAIVLKLILVNFPEAIEKKQCVSYVYPDAYTTNREAILGDIGILDISTTQFVAALDTFLRGGQWEDACYIAERVLDLDDLKLYIDQHEGDEGLDRLEKMNWYGNRVSTNARIRYILARRLAREARYDEALQYYPPAGTGMDFSVEVPDDDIVTIFDEFVQDLRIGRDEYRPTNIRAEHLFRAAKTMRYFGMEIIGAEVDPDWTVYDGSYKRNGPDKTRVYNKFSKWDTKPEGDGSIVDKLVLATDEEKKQVKKHVFKPEKRFHYRYIAAELMYDAAMLLPENDDLAARALIWAGSWLKARDGAAAEKYYKALLKHCPDNHLTIEAKEIHWFPTISHDDDPVQ